MANDQFATDPGMGPVIQWPGGGRQPLTWPILLMSVWPNLIAYWGGKPPLTHLNIMETWFHLDKWTELNVPKYDGYTIEDVEDTPLLTSAASKQTDNLKQGWNLKEKYDAGLEYRVIDGVSRWMFEAARFVAWFFVFQVSFFINLIIPLVGLRMLTGKESIYAP
jgi:hypothetical protein